MPPLVGWYLMVPPFDALNETRISRWDVISSFDTAASCQSALNDLPDSTNDPHFMAEIAKQIKAQGRTFAPEAGKRRLLAARCFSTDDPRLKENRR
jgi:hypothetical protein